MSEERVFLHAEQLYVSNTKVLLQGTTYATANITSVSKRLTPANSGCAILLAVIGGFWLLITFASFDARDPAGSLAGMFIAACVCAVAVIWYRSLKPTFHVFLASASGERQGLSSQDEGLVNRVIEAITAAITYRG